MTPEEVFARLRDIHTPPSARDAALVYDFRPLAFFAIVLIAFVVTRSLWKYVSDRRALSRIDQTAPYPEQRDALVSLLDRRARRPASDKPPAAIFEPPNQLSQSGIRDLRHWVGRRLR